MGLFDFITNAQDKMLHLQNKTQDKISELQKRINENPAEADFMQLKSKIKTDKPMQSKRKTKSAAVAKPDSTDQILAQRDSFIRNGFAEYEFIANRDCCDVCRNLNGKHFPVRKLAIGVNAPPMHEGCRCSISAYSDREEFDEWLDFVSKGGTTAEYNNRKKSK